MKERRAVPCIGNGHSLIRLNFDWVGQLYPVVRSWTTNSTRDLKKITLGKFERQPELCKNFSNTIKVVKKCWNMVRIK